MPSDTDCQMAHVDADCQLAHAGAILGLSVLLFALVWNGISMQVGAAVAIALPVSERWKSSCYHTDAHPCCTYLHQILGLPASKHSISLDASQWLLQ